MTVTFEVVPQVGVRFHELANLFPMMQDEALAGLREDIRVNGVQSPIVFLDGAIIDGRNRYMCARDLGIEYPRVEFEGDDPLAFVVSLNLRRRHLTESQRASIAARLANMGVGENQHSRGSANLQTLTAPLPGIPESPQQSLVSQANAARLLIVSERSVASARKVHDKAPELVAAVDAGALSVSLAAQVANLPEAARADVAAAPLDEVRNTAREAVRKPFVANNSGNNEWYTPLKIIEAARSVLGGFDLDPASSEIANEIVGAARIFTTEDDGLAQDWPIGRIWMNPPYASGLVGKFIDRFAASVRCGSSGIVLVNNATETAWFQALVGVASAVCFHKSRICYVTPEGEQGGAPLQGQAIIYCGPDATGFAARFAAFGAVLFTGAAA